MFEYVYFYKWIKVTDIETNTILCIGQYKNSQITQPQCISVDNKYFWKLGEGQKYKIEIITNKEEQKEHPLVQLPSNYTVKDLESGLDADVYIGKTMDECDKEIMPLVKVLNLIPDLKTVSSGNGHGKEPARVSFFVSSLQPLLFISQIIYNHFPNRWRLVTDQHVFNGEGAPYFYISLETIKHGNSSFKDIIELTEYLMKKLVA